MMDWVSINNIILRNYKRTSDATGNPSYPPLKMFIVLLLQTWYDLSDPMTGSSRQAFSPKVHRFSSSDDIPDYSTVLRYYFISNI
jgi:IS5 family transposase